MVHQNLCWCPLWNTPSSGEVKPSHGEMYGERLTDGNNWPTAKQLYTNGWGRDEEEWESFYSDLRFIPRSPGRYFYNHPERNTKRAAATATTATTTATATAAATTTITAAAAAAATVVWGFGL